LRWKFWEKRQAVTYNGNGSSWTDVTQSSGTGVTEQSALQLTAVSAAIRAISEPVASLPLVLYKRVKDGRGRAEEHPLYSLLHDAPNDLMSSMEFREWITVDAITRGKGYAEIEWDAYGQVKALWPLRAENTTEYYDERNRTLEYVTFVNGVGYKLPAYRVFVLKGPLGGKSLIRLHAEALGLAKATESYGNKFFTNGARPSGVLEHPGSLTDDSATRLKASWHATHGGLENAHRVAILEEGMKYKQISFPPEDAQFLETRKFQLGEIARIFRVPPHKISDLDKATFSNIEHQSMEFLTDSLQPWMIRWEQAITMRLLVGKERKKYYAEHLAEALLRSDTKARYESYQIARQNGWMSPNDILKKENQNPIPAEQGGDTYMVNTAMQPVSVLLKGGDEGNGKNGTANPNGSNGDPNGE
jgi:HK97 family phage portal protein